MEKYLLLKINIRSVSENAYLTLAKNIGVKGRHERRDSCKGGGGGRTEELPTMFKTNLVINQNNVQSGETFL